MVLKSDPSKNGSNQLNVGFNLGNLSKNKKFNELLKSVIDNVKLYAEDQMKHIIKLSRIGLALSAEKDINKLLELIVDETGDLSNADAGTLYIRDDQKKHLGEDYNMIRVRPFFCFSGANIPFCNQAQSRKNNVLKK